MWPSPKRPCTASPITHHSDVIRQKVAGALFRPFEALLYARARLLLSTGLDREEGEEEQVRARGCGRMPRVEFYVVGTGGAGREVLDVALALRMPVTAFLDDRPADRPVRDLPVVRPSDAVPGCRAVA